MTDFFRSHKPLLVDPVSDAFNITANSNVFFAHTTRKIYVGGTGNIELELASISRNANTVVTFYNVPQGTMLDVRAVRCLEGNTSATNLLGLF